MRRNVEIFVKNGGNIAFFSGNTCWWQIRISPDGSQMVCYKVAGFDPLSTSPDHALTTIHWFDDLVNRPETTMTGVSWLEPTLGRPLAVTRIGTLTVAVYPFDIASRLPASYFRPLAG